LDAVRGPLAANRSPERPTEPNTCLVSVEELIRVLLQQAGRAEKPDASRGDVISREFERPEHSAAIEERPGDVADAFDSNSVGEAAKMSCRRLVERTDKVRFLIRD
jgi:hypothetical protein